MATRNPYVNTPKDRHTVQRLWERYLGGVLGEGDVRLPYTRAMVGEWRRCQSLNVNVRMERGIRLPRNRYEQVLERDRSLLTTASPILKNVCHLLSNVPIILILTDAEGNILKILGDPYVLQQAELSNIVEGSCWREELAGNNGLGTALHYKTPVHVFAAEHYCEGWHKWSCAATPILDAITQDVIGVVDLTSLEKDYRDEALGLSYSLASQIQLEVKLQGEASRIHLINTYLELAARYPGEALAIADRSGTVVRMNHKAESCIDGPRVDLNALKGRGVKVQGHDINMPGQVSPVGRWYLLYPPVPTGSGGILIRQPGLKAYGDFLTGIPALMETMERIRRVAKTDLTVLITGETGTGKEAVARFIHESSQRSSRPFVAVNCGAIGKDLFESRLFGYEKGAFTGADPSGRKGFFETANGGTLFLDEIGELPLDMQAALLRTLETKKVRRLGSEVEITTDFRLIAATNRPLAEELADGKFRSDLYFRLEVSHFSLPPLRERKQDVPELITHFLGTFSRKYGGERHLTPEAMAILEAYPWPGNVRELKNLLESLAVQAEAVITVADLPTQISQATAKRNAHAVSKSELHADDWNLRQQEWRLIQEVLQQHKQVKLAARAMGISRSTLYRKMREHGIQNQPSI